MKDLYTKVVVPVSEKKIEYSSKILLLGSCFADNIGEKFGENYFQAIVNPFGTLYNPASIMNAIDLSLAGNKKHYILAHNDLWHSMMHHGSFSTRDKLELITRCESSQTMMAKAITDSDTIIVTFGTSWIYKMEEFVVANCHKMPANRFRRECMSSAEIVSMWLPLLTKYPNKHWIFTVSPIRHVKDGFHANHLSKACLLQAIDTLISNAECINPASSYSYFPSYEIMLDELRDYRFYAEDMVHPSSLAVEYIWNRFLDTYMSDNTREQMRVLHQLWRDRHHRCLHPESQEAKAFEQHLSERVTKLKQLYPWLE